MDTKTNSLNDFTGFNADNFNFFDENPTGQSIENGDALSAALKDDPTQTPPTTPENSGKGAEPEADLSVFEGAWEEDNEGPSIEINEEDDDTGKINTSTPAISITSKSTLDFLKDKGFLDYELPEGKTELSDAEADDVLEDAWEKSLTDAISETIEGLDPIAKKILEVAHKGGDVKGLIKSFSSNLSASINKDTDMSQESNQILAITLDLKEQGFDNEYIETHIETLKTTQKLEAMAKKSSDRVVAKQDAIEAASVETASKLAEQRKINQRTYKANLVSFLGENKEIEGIAVNKKEVESFASYIADPTITLQSGEVVTELQRDIFAAMADKNSLYILAKMMKGKQGKLDLSFITNKAVSKFSREVKDNIQNTEDAPINRPSGSSRSKRSLADHF